MSLEEFLTTKYRALSSELQVLIQNSKVREIMASSWERTLALPLIFLEIPFEAGIFINAIYGSFLEKNKTKNLPPLDSKNCPT